MVSVTTGTAILLALPVVAAGQVPVVEQVVGGVTETAQSIVPAAPALPAPPAQVQAPAPKAPAPAPAPAAPAPAASAPAASPPAAPRQSAPAAPQSASSLRQGLRAQRVQTAASASKDRGGVSAQSASDTPAQASQDNSSDESAGSAEASQAVGLPEDANPDTLPFTGLQLALIAMAGLAALAAGAALRRGTRIARR